MSNLYWATVMNAPGLHTSILLVLGCFLVGPHPTVRADGFVLDKSGRYVPEQEQQAFIEWHDGMERLFIHTRTAESSESTLWIVPVPASPELVRAEPVAKFPVVGYERNIVISARTHLERLGAYAIILDTGLLPLTCLAMMGCGSDVKSASGLTVHQHVERLGMVLEILTAQSPTALDEYLTRKQLYFRATGITAMTPYLNQNHTLICAWAAEPSTKPSARAVRIDFPTPFIFYPLRPTSVYESSIKSSIYVKGWVRQQARSETSTIKCHYVVGQVREIDPDDKTERSSLKGRYGEGEPLTRVQLPSEPSSWTEDLSFEPGVPNPIRVCQALDALGEGLPWMLSAVLGVILAPLLPVLVISRSQRTWGDYLWAVFVGGAMCLSVFASAALFFVWCRMRRLPPGGGTVKSESEGVRMWALCFVLTGGVFLIGGSLFATLYGPGIPHEFLDVVLVTSIVLLAAVPISLLVYSMYSRIRASIWLLAFAGMHLGAMLLVGNGLRTWLAAWE
jgi:hypothetical protein